MEPFTRASLLATYGDFSVEDMQDALKEAQDYLVYDTERSKESSATIWPECIDRDNLTIEVLTELIVAKSAVAS